MLAISLFSLLVCYTVVLISSNLLHTTAFGQVLDETPPEITVPEDMTVEATGPEGAAVSFEVSAVDTVDGVVGVTCNYYSGKIFAIGEIVIACSAVDEAGNQETASFRVTVTDTTAPAIAGTRNILVEAAATADSTQITFTASAEDTVDGASRLEEDGTTLTQDDVGGSITISCGPPSGFEFPIGVTTVRCSAVDEAGNEREGFFTVTVEEEVVVVGPESTIDPLTVGIISNGTEDVTPATFGFEANVIGGSEPYSYSWDFDGDGTEDSKESSVPYAFYQTGTYNVSLTATDADNQNAYDNIVIAVNEPPLPPPPPPPPDGGIILLIALGSIVIGGIALGKYKMNRRSSRRLKVPPSAIVEIRAKGGIG